MPTTIRRIQKLKEKRRQKAEKEKAEREAEKVILNTYPLVGGYYAGVCAFASSSCVAS